MSGHTPGPWKWRNHKGSITKCELVGADGTVICVAESGDGGVPADDELIAAAPELLRELIHLRRCLHPWIESGHRVPGIATLNGADAAIAKAAEESQ